MVTNKLQLNSDKTECTLFYVRNKLKDTDINQLNIGNDVVTFVNKAYNLGMNVDDKLSMESHVSHLCKLVYL